MNKNPYEAPKSDVSTELPTEPSIKRKLIWTARIIFTALLYRGINKVAPSFAETFSSFGAELPSITQFFVKAYPVFYWLGIISIFPIFFWLVNIFSEKYALIIIKISQYNLYLALFFFALFMFSMYLPIFSMGSVN